MSRGWEELESGRISDLIRSKAYFERLVEFHWEYYSELEFQRNQIREQLKSSLRDTAQPFEFTKWQRIVRYKYSLTPLSTKGSLVDPGGRFNIGDIDCARYPVFPALYIASDKGTALAEVLGREKGTGSLTPSVITSKAANGYHFKTGQRDWPSRTENVLPCRLLWWQVGFGAPAPRATLEHVSVVQ